MPRGRRRRPIRALFLDVDGVLTDGRLYLDGRGNEFKVFNTKDGLGIRKAAAAGITLCWISGRRSPATARRARELGVPYCFQGVRDKGARVEALRRRLRLSAAETAVVGDDELDIPMFEGAGLSACPADGAPAARRAADVVLKAPGGGGAVREFVELILKRDGKTGLFTRGKNSPRVTPPGFPSSGRSTPPRFPAGRDRSSGTRTRTASRRPGSA